MKDNFSLGLLRRNVKQAVSLYYSQVNINLSSVSVFRVWLMAGAGQWIGSYKQFVLAVGVVLL